MAAECASLASGFEEEEIAIDCTNPVQSWCPLNVYAEQNF
jgi:hypothetical protein